LIQRIGLATSEDLIHWERHPGNPLIEADPQWYEILDLDLWHDQAWRDPWVFMHEGKFHAYITARCNSGQKSARGVIGHAVSTDIVNWVIEPPVTEPGEFGYLEVPQLVEIEGRWYLFFSVTHDKYAQKRLSRPGVKLQTGTHYLIGDTPIGPFRHISDDFLVGDKIGSLYSGKVLQNPKGEWVFMAFRLFDSNNQFLGELADPLPLNLKQNGELEVVLR
jgi:beta-fructofuranosidase